MNRRSFLKFAGAVVGGIAVEQAIPLGRVWSFPSKIVVPQPEGFIDLEAPFRIERDYYSIRWDELNRITREHFKSFEVFADPKMDLSPLMRQWMAMKEWPPPLQPLAPEAEPRTFKYPIIGNIAWHRNRRTA